MGSTRDVTLIHVGGHFAGSAVLHWKAGAEGKGVLLSGDTLSVSADLRWVSFMYSFPNRIPLSASIMLSGGAVREANRDHRIARGG
ncbi:hypothetical protein [Alicyclobacillus herbarius]|uniref:hypothetical protein n=1 Tax=Alicyclobacillus herbarius TaxID=122960 RepID=UPI001B7FC326|nr:hypothetical protein [Alicyclobacillus herbarius]